MRGERGTVSDDPIERLESTDSVLVAGSPVPGSRRRRLIAAVLVVLVALIIGSLVAMNIAVSRPVARVLAGDSRNEGFTVKAHLRGYTDSSVLVLDLRDVSDAAPADLWRGLFQAAEAFDELERSFERVLLARSGQTVFMLSGDDFQSIGRLYAAGENPVYLLRTLPEKLYSSDGEAAYPTWEGGWLGVAAEQLNDVNDAASVWATGR